MAPMIRSLFVAGLLASACGSVDRASDAPTNPGDGPVIDAPANPADAPGPKKAFVTSRVYTGNMGGVAMADAQCQLLANGAGLTGTYKAWLSTSTQSAANRMTQSPGPYVRVDNTPIANSWADLTTGGLATTLSLDEMGNGGPLQSTAVCSTLAPVWTGTFPNGDTGTGSTCLNWGSTSNQGMLGNFNSSGTEWSFVCTISNCTNLAPIYCFEQ